jgi:RNA polymerase sigma-70 factor (ECF subfamily)
MDDADSLTDLVQRCRDGDREAFDRLFALYARRLARVAENHLSRKLAARVGPDDIVQSVFRTFFRRSTQGDLQINDSAHLWHLLVRMTLLKVKTKWRFHTAGERSLAREVAGDDAWLAGISGRDPGPEEAAVAVDLMEALVNGLDPLHAEVLALLVRGHSVAEVAQKLKKTRQSIYRIRALLEHRLIRLGEPL